MPHRCLRHDSPPLVTGVGRSSARLGQSDSIPGASEALEVRPVWPRGKAPWESLPVADPRRQLRRVILAFPPEVRATLLRTPASESEARAEVIRQLL